MSSRLGGDALARAAHRALAEAPGAEDAFAEHTVTASVSSTGVGVARARLSLDAGIAVRHGLAGSRLHVDAFPLQDGPPDEAALDPALAGELARRAAAAARDAEPTVIWAEATLTATRRRFALARRDGHTAADDQVRLRLEVMVRAERGIRRCGGSANGVQRVAPGRAVPGWAEGVGRRAARRARRGFEAVAVPAGPLVVVLQGSAAGVLLHEALGHGLEADLLARGDSPYADRVGQRVAPDVVTVVDDGAVPGQAGSIGVDDEGVAPRSTVLVERGVLCGALVDRAWAAKGAGPPGGNGRRASFRDPPLPRMTCTYLAAGDDDPAALVASAGDGLLCRGMHAGSWDRARGEITFMVGEATLIEGGSPGPPAQPVTLAGRGPELLQGLVAVGSDLAFSEEFHTCTKAGQVLPVGVGSPTFLVRGLRAALR